MDHADRLGQRSGRHLELRPEKHEFRSRKSGRLPDDLCRDRTVKGVEPGNHDLEIPAPWTTPNLRIGDGDDLALVHIDRAMQIEPAAHFGREGYHRRLVVYLKAVAADPKGATETAVDLHRRQHHQARRPLQ